MYAKDLSEPKYQFLIEKRRNAGIKNYNDPIAFIEFIEYCNTMDDVFSNIDDYNPKRKRKILIVFDDMVADIMNLLNIVILWMTFLVILMITIQREREKF